MSGLNISANNNLVVNSRQVRGNRTCPSVPAQNSYPNLAPLDKDTVNFKGQTTTQKKKGMSTFGKICLGLLGVGAVAYAGVVTHRIKTKPTIDKVAQNFSEIFRKDVSKEEAQKMVNQYQEIFKENDVDTCCKKMFEQIKKDYGYENIDIRLEIDKITNISRKDEVGGGWLLGKSKVFLRPDLTEGKDFNKVDTFKTLIHEFQHIKQSEIAYRTDSNRYLQALKKDGGVPKDKQKLAEELKKMKKILKDENRLSLWAKEREQSIEELKKDIQKALDKGDYSSFEFNETKARKNLDNLFGKFPKISTDTVDYKKGLQYIDNEANYIHASDDKEGYFKQIIEKEAYDSEKKLNPFFEYIKNLWKL